MSPSDAFPSASNVRSALVHWLFSPLAGVTFGNWMQVLRQRGLRVPPRYWPRAAFTMGMSVLNSAVARRERRYKSAVEDVEVEAPVFVIGHHRSGTTHLWKLLATDDRFSYPSLTETLFPHTFLTFEPIAQALAKKFSPQHRPQDDVQVAADSPLGEEWALCTSTFLSPHMARHFPQEREQFKKYLTMRNAPPAERTQWKRDFDRFARKLLARHGRRSTPLFKAPHHTARLPLLLDLYPDARFVHIYRNPLRVYKSTMRMEKEALPFCSYQSWDADDLEDFVLWRYRTLYDAFFEDVGRVPDEQLAEVRFEDLVDDRVGAVEHIYEELSLPGFEAIRPALERYVDSIDDYETNNYPSLSPEKRRRIAEAWRPSYRRWSYSVDGVDTSSTTTHSGRDSDVAHDRRAQEGAVVHP